MGNIYHVDDVSKKSSSVSPGKPMITSVVMAASGSCCWILWTMFKNFSQVWPHPMAFNISIKPDWKGTWKYSHAIGIFATTSTTPKLMYQRCDGTKQRRFKSGTAPTVINKSENLSICLQNSFDNPLYQSCMSSQRLFCHHCNQGVPLPKQMPIWIFHYIEMTSSNLHFIWIHKRLSFGSIIPSYSINVHLTCHP